MTDREELLYAMRLGHLAFLCDLTEQEAGDLADLADLAFETLSLELYNTMRELSYAMHDRDN